jgi:hypothetical protein
VVATMVLVLTTVFVMGGTTEFVLSLLRIEMNVDEEKYMETWHKERRSAGRIIRFEDFVQRHVLRAELAYADAPNSESSLESGRQSPSAKLSAVTSGDMLYCARIERTESENMHYVTSPGYGIAARKRKESLFDYGSKN